MVRLADLSETERQYLESLDCPSFEETPCVTGLPLNQRRVAIIATAGLHKQGDRPFSLVPGDNYRVIPENLKASDLLMSHVSIGFDRSAFRQDWNVVFPIDRLKELAQSNVIGSVADFHYSFMGAHNPLAMEDEARKIAALLKNDKVDAALFLPV